MKKPRVTYVKKPCKLFPHECVDPVWSCPFRKTGYCNLEPLHLQGSIRSFVVVVLACWALL